MRKNNKKALALAILTASMLILTACGKSEEEKAADEIYSHLSAEEQANVDKDREEIANYEAIKKVEVESYEAAKQINYIDVLTEWELGKDMLYCPEPFGFGGTVEDLDFGHSLSILYPAKEYVECAHSGYYDVGRQSSGLFVFRASYYVREGDISIMGGTEEEIGNYKLSTNLGDYQFLGMSIYDKDSDKSIIIEISGAGGGMYNKELVSKNYDFIVEQIKSWKQNETSDEETPNEETANKESVQGKTPYGVYECESDAMAYVESWQNEIDIIDIFLNDDELMTNFEWVEGKTYNLIMPNAASPLATATFDESGNMRITALSDEAKPYEGYYIIILLYQ